MISKETVLKLRMSFCCVVVNLRESKRKGKRGRKAPDKEPLTCKRDKRAFRKGVYERYMTEESASLTP